ncbi:MAG TPA: adenylate/guanylate cyclase domain-containing protein [Acetobacteraceae bacterium]|nr:adenylate/guanylate cyclase domain-containing protein [Acetobacteraceae bacterium]
MRGAASSENGTDLGSRRAAVVAFVDIVGSSILLAEDEAGTHARWMRLLREVIRPQTGRFRGRIVKSTGDGVLAEFPTGRDGIEWGREVQLASQRLAMAEPALSRAILLRIALNVGNVIVTDEDIYGVSVHTAARLQEHAEPGGIVLTEAVREQAGDAVGRDVRDLGMVHLKGFAQPVRVYALPPELRIRPALARPRPAHLPSIAVMPLENLGGDPTDEYFAAGIVEDIIVSLGGLHELMVISRASTVTFRQHPADVREVGQRLGVHYVMTGSVRRSPRTLRVSAQLCDAESGANLWGDTTESPTEKLFEIQDLIVQRIVAGIAPNIRAEELRRALRKRPESFTAYDYTLRALDVINSLNAATFSRARAHLEAAMQEDPGFALPVAWMARWHSLRIGQGWSKDRRRDASRAMALAGRAIELDRHNALALATYAHVRSYLFHDYDAALVYFDRAISACPNSALARVLSSLTLSYVGRGEEALRQGEQALRLSPVDQLLFFYYVALAVAHLSLANYEEAIRWGRMCTSENPKFTANLRILIAALVGAGRDQEARSAAACLLRQTPGFSLREYKQSLQPFRDDAIRERYLEQLARAGLPA